MKNKFLINLLKNQDDEIFTRDNYIMNENTTFSNKFIKPMRNTERNQYKDIYNSRFDQLKPLLIENVKKHYPSITIHEDILNSKGKVSCLFNSKLF